ncbi:MAG: hypothetical protein MPEBLZ_02396 [Candidatus Methanoperedens nitroreducens]|uniref:Uncharacterized protein n=1 Tax=Candidatus Methanoperedens nitratireducens TaxID=1392998 RepID=A0A0P8AFG4_9EURY|nr:MAG: hypothetical protein MPEBLZ_02396 [Candidatus Methanoperedens sp. BLZ1]CAG0974537.1 hypothetical protein METP2_01595 [Methanosarcinales archaeon]
MKSWNPRFNVGSMIMVVQLNNANVRFRISKKLIYLDRV